MISEAGLRRHAVQPFNMLNNLWSSFCFLIERCLDPFEPVAFFKPRWHICDSLIPYECFQSSDASVLKLCHIVPPIVYFSVIAASMVPSHSIFAIRNQEVAIEWWHVYCVLPVVAFIIRVFWVRIVYRLPQLLHVFLIGYLLVEIAIFRASAVVRGYCWPFDQHLVLSVRSANHMSDVF